MPIKAVFTFPNSAYFNRLLRAVSARQNLDELSFEIKNAALVRTISNASGVLRATKLEANHRAMLDTPNIEFMLDVDYKGDLVMLVPTDFVIKATETRKIGPENRFSVQLKCKKEGVEVLGRNGGDEAGGLLQRFPP